MLFYKCHEAVKIIMKFYLYPIFRIIIKFNWIQQKTEQNSTKCAQVL
jgi:hypothetical protein